MNSKECFDEAERILKVAVEGQISTDQRNSTVALAEAFIKLGNARLARWEATQGSGYRGIDKLNP